MNEPAIDETIYRELQEASGAEFVVELVGTFLEEAPRILTELRKARADGDADKFRRAAHSLKSNGATFGALGLAALARELELKGLDADASQDAERLSALAQEYGRAAAALKALSNG
jgi:HPt (histidine-containing phosphotransfer) domain-containing protein